MPTLNSNSGNTAAQTLEGFMIALSASCVAIASAIENGLLRIENVEGRYGEYFTISDNCGLIEVATDRAEVDARVDEIKRRMAA